MSAFCLALLAGLSRAADSPEEIARGHLLHAETFYWRGVIDRGDPASFEKGLSFLAQVDPGATSPSTLSRIQSLRKDLQDQAALSRARFFGTYPLARVLAPVLVSDPGPPGLYETTTRPSMTAARIATRDLIELIRGWLVHPQIGVVITGSLDPAIRSSVQYLFAQQPEFEVRLGYEVEGALTPALLEEFKSEGVTPRVSQALLAGLGARNLVVVDVRELDRVEDVVTYGANAHLFRADTGDFVRRLSTRSITIDRRAQHSLTLQVGILLLVAAALFTALLLRCSRRRCLAWIPGLGIGAGAYLVALVVAAALTPILNSVAPNPEVLAHTAWWWPTLAVTALLVSPPLCLRVLASRIASVPAIPDLDGRLGVLSGAATLGVGAFLLGPLFYLRPEMSWALLLPLLLAMSCLGYLLGEAIDSLGSTPSVLALAAVLPMAFVSQAVMRADPSWMQGATGVGFLVPAVAILWVQTRVAWSSRELPKPEAVAEQTTTPLDALLDRNPRYLPLGHFDEALRRTGSLAEGGCIWIALSGDAGVGKTATATAILNHIKSGPLSRGASITSLSGRCGDAPDVPYEPFRQALAGHFNLDLQAQRSRQIEKLDAALRDLVSSAVPMASILFASKQEDEGAISSGREIVVSILQMIGSLSNGGPVLLFFDDIHAMDGASRALLARLNEHFPPGLAGPRLAVVLTSQDRGAFDGLDLTAGVLEIGEPKREDRERILRESLSIDAVSTSWIVDQVGEAGSGRGALYWVLHVVADLARAGALRPVANGFRLSEEHLDGTPLQIPQDFRDVLRGLFHCHPRFRTVLEAAACIGREFPVGVLAESLEKSRLDLLDMLREIESETGIVHDVLERDEYFAFRSGFMLSVIREELSICRRGPNAPDVPQIIREYHARIATALEQENSEDAAAIYEMAGQYYAAGARWAREAVRSSRTAAQKASRVFDFARAEAFLQMAGECASILGEEDLVAEDLLHLECNRAHVTGEGQGRAATIALDYLHEHADAPFQVLRAGARACYDAGRSEGSAHFIAESVRLAHRMVEVSTTPAEEAEGRHFLGLGGKGAGADVEASLTELRTAIALIEGSPELPIQRLEARIRNSLATMLAHGTPEQRREAREQFECCLLKRTDRRFGDLPGLARTHGGLGRLYYMEDPADLAKARYHFAEDLRIAGEIGDRRGQCLMQSLLARCDKDEGRYEAALEQYRAAWKIADARLDRIFAATGRLECICRLVENGIDDDSLIEEAKAAAEVLTELVSTTDVPTLFIQDLQVALGKCRFAEKPQWWIDLDRAVAAVPKGGKA